MAVTKLSVSFDSDLADTIRAAAAEEGVPVSAWLAEAAQARVRNYLLGVALREIYADDPMTPEEVERVVAEARSQAIRPWESASGAA